MYQNKITIDILHFVCYEVYITNRYYRPIGIENIEIFCKLKKYNILINLNRYLNNMNEIIQLNYNIIRCNVAYNNY